MKVSSYLNSKALIRELHSNAKAVREGSLEPQLNNSANVSYRNMFALIKLELVAEKQANDAKRRAKTGAK